jgi:Amt family ammonium transporter
MILMVPVPLTIAGYALIHVGFGRVRGAAFAIFSSMVVISIAAIVYCIFGFSLEGYAGGAAYSLTIGGRPWNWIAHEPFLMRGLNFYGPNETLAAILQIFTVGLAALIPLSAGADRWRLRSICISTALFAGLSYPLFAHWVWGGGWLRTSDLLVGHGFLDPGGASTIHVMGGLSALAIAWILGPRRGKFSSDGRPTAIPGHNIVYVLFGCVLLLPGWIALNAIGAMLFAGLPPSGIPLIMMTTILCAAASCFGAVVITRIRFLKPDASLCANGWVGGLVASSAVCCYVSPLGALLTGLIAGLLVTFSVEMIEVFLRTDDPGGAISVHAVAGLWGLLAVGIFPFFPLTGGKFFLKGSILSDQMLAQSVGIVTLLGVMLPMTYGLNWLLNLIDPQRMEERNERKGMDLQELGGVAYPEFVIQPED